METFTLIQQMTICMDLRQVDLGEVQHQLLDLRVRKERPARMVPMVRMVRMVQTAQMEMMEQMERLY